MKVIHLATCQQTEYGLKRELSQFKIHLHMKQPPNRRYYGADSHTIARLLHRQATDITFDGQKGLENCEAIEARYRGKYYKATIYQRQANDTWVEVSTFFDGEAPVVQLPQPARIVKMRVVHNAYNGALSLIPNQQAA